MRRASPGLSSTRRMRRGRFVMLSLRRQTDNRQPEAVDRTNHGEERVDVDGFRDVAVGVQVVALDHVALRLRGGQYDDRNATEVLILLDLREHLAPVLLR